MTSEADSAQPKSEADSTQPRSEADSAQPQSAVPPWEITDSFLAVLPAEPSGPPWATEHVAPSAPAVRRGQGTTAGGPADSTESLPAVDPVADYSLFPPTFPGDSTESLPAARPRRDLEDAFRLFPPTRGTGNEPPGSDSQD